MSDDDFFGPEPDEDDPLEEGDDGVEYDEEAFKAENEKINAQLAASGKVEAVPQGVMDQGDPELEERAARARAGIGAQAVSRDELGTFKTTKAGNAVLPVGQMEQLLARLAQLEQRIDSGGSGEEVSAVPNERASQDAFAPENVRPQPQKRRPTAIYMAADYGGRFRLWRFPTMEMCRGYAQNTPGIRRLFIPIEGSLEFQEINGLGKPIHRE